MTLCLNEVKFHHFTCLLRNQHKSKLPVGLLVQLVEHCIGITERSFFNKPYFHYCLSSVHYCEDHEIVFITLPVRCSYVLSLFKFINLNVREILSNVKRNLAQRTPN